MGALAPRAGESEEMEGAPRDSATRSTTLSFKQLWVDELKRFVGAAPEAWGYTSPQDVIREAVRDLYSKKGWDPRMGFAGPKDSWRDPMDAPPSNPTRSRRRRSA